MKLHRQVTSRGYPYYRFSDLAQARTRARASARKRLPHVHDTWLARCDDARLQSLLIGYVAQEVMEKVFQDARIPYVCYDETRIDKSRNDDPFDFLLFPPRTRIDSIVADLQSTFYPLINSQGRFKKVDQLEFKAFVHAAGGRVCDLKSSVDNHRHGIDEIIRSQHHIAYAEQKNSAGFRVITGKKFLAERGQTYDEYVVRKQAIKDIHFRVFFEDETLSCPYYVGFIPGRRLILEGDVGPFPGTPWVLYHRMVIDKADQPGEELKKVFV